MRRYIRHPSDIPIQISRNETRDLANENLLNLSYGGLSFFSSVSYAVGSHLTIIISIVSPVYEAQARVCWCEVQENGFDIGVELLSKNDAFKTRMVEQVCHVAHYKRQVFLAEGRNLSGAEAAREWINKFAQDFPC